MISDRIAQAFEANSDTRGLISHGYTYSGHPVGAAAALATLAEAKRLDLAANAAARGAELMAGLHALKSRHAVIGDVRGIGLPHVTASYGFTAADRLRIGQAMAEHFLIASDVGEMEPGWSPNLYAFGGSTHFMGSCRMGAVDDGTSVVDGGGRVWGYDNLYVADNSVIGSSNSGNPTFMMVAQALRTADRILAR